MNVFCLYELIWFWALYGSVVNVSIGERVFAVLQCRRLKQNGNTTRYIFIIITITILLSARRIRRRVKQWKTRAVKEVGPSILQ